MTYQYLNIENSLYVCDIMDFVAADIEKLTHGKLCVTVEYYPMSCVNSKIYHTIKDIIESL